MAHLGVRALFELLLELCPFRDTWLKSYSLVTDVLDVEVVAVAGDVTAQRQDDLKGQHGIRARVV